METEYLEPADQPQLSTAVKNGPFLDYSVGLCRVRDEKITFLGSGVLVTKGSRYGILTARHCLHACKPEVSLGKSGGDELYVVLRLGHSVRVQSVEAKEHVLVKPPLEEPGEFGPDLAYIEILAVQRLASFKAIASFYSLDRNPGEIAQNFAGVGTPVVSVGFPEEHNTQRTGRGGICLNISAMQLCGNAIKDGDAYDKGEWDFIESHFNEDCTSGLPRSFKGFSGGPVWGMKLRKSKIDGQIRIEEHALIGINFYEVASRDGERRMRAHFIKSIYELAWKNLG